MRLSELKSKCEGCVRREECVLCNRKTGDGCGCWHGDESKLNRFIYYIDTNDEDETEVARMGGFFTLTECVKDLSADKRLTADTHGTIEEYDPNGECVAMFDEYGEEL